MNTNTGRPDAGLAAATPALRVDPRARDEVVAACRELADRRFEEVVDHPDAPPIFKGGKATVPDENGFRRRRPKSLRTFLEGQLGEVVDRLEVPVPRPLHDGATSIQLRGWPVWAVGTKLLAALADLEAAEHLGDALGRGCRLAPAELAAYARLRRTNRLGPCFVPSEGRAYLRVHLLDLPAVALTAVLEHDSPPSAVAAALRGGERPGAWARRVLPAGADVPPLTEDQAGLALALAGTGSGDGAIAVLLGWLGDALLTAGQAGALVELWRAACPALDRHLADRSLDRLAASLGATPEELAGWAGADPADRRRSFLYAFAGSGLADRLPPVSPSDLRSKVAAIRVRGFRSAGRHAPPSHVARVARERAYVLREDVTLPGGGTLPDRSWVEARSAFVELAADAILAAEADLIAAGHAVVAAAGDELVVEAPRPGAGRDAVARVAEAAAGAVLGRLPVRAACEEVALW